METAGQKELLDVLLRVSRGELSPDVAAAEIQHRGAVPTTDACVDTDRARRCGFPEVVYCSGKTAASIEQIFRTLLEHQQDCLGTRVSPDQAEHLQRVFPESRYNPVARTIAVSRGDSAITARQVCVVAAGTSDRPVAEEAVETLRWMRVPVELILDVGVAGPQRLTRHLDKLHAAAAVVVVAGMEGALPSVVGGHLKCPVIGVPTSVGYGANLGGISALLSMLNSCASNVTVVNIDAGFKGGFIAGLIAAGADHPEAE